MQHNIIGVIITAIVAFTVSAGGHGVLGSSVSEVGNDHHQAEHESGLTYDNLAATHSEETQCHAADAQEFLVQASSNVQVVLIETIRTYIVTESLSIRKPIAYSLLEKVPLFELAKIHTTTLALRV